MKKTLLALAVAGVAAASVASATTVYEKDGTTLGVYGRVQAVTYSQDSLNTAKSGDAGLVGSGRLGIDARTDLGYGIAGIAKAEWDVADADDNGNFNARYVWVGADFGAFGKLIAGRTDNAIKYVNDTTDIFEDFGQYATVAGDNKRDGQFLYSWNGYGVDVLLSYSTAKDDTDFAPVAGGYIYESNDPDNPTHWDVKGTFGAAIGYTSPDVLFGPIAVKAGYDYIKFQDDATAYKVSGKDYLDNAKSWAAALSWGTDGVGPYVGVLYNQRSYNVNESINPKADGAFKDYKVQGVEAVVSYGFENGVQIKTGYEWMKVDFDSQSATVARAKNASTAAIPVYVNYNVNDNFNVWAEARFDVGTDDDGTFDANNGVIGGNNWNVVTGGDDKFEEPNQNVYSVGARYTF